MNVPVDAMKFSARLSLRPMHSDVDMDSAGNMPLLEFNLPQLRMFYIGYE